MTTDDEFYQKLFIITNYKSLYYRNLY